MSKKGIQTTKNTKEFIQGGLEKIKKAKARVDRKVDEENKKWRAQFAADIRQARVKIVERKNYLYCQLSPTERPFKVLKQDHLTTIRWFVDGIKVTRRHMECGSGGASLGVGMGGGIRSCETIGGPHDSQGLYTYQVPKEVSDKAQFVCRLSFPKTPMDVLNNLLSVDSDSLTHVIVLRAI